MLFQSWPKCDFNVLSENVISDFLVVITSSHISHIYDRCNETNGVLQSVNILKFYIIENQCPSIDIDNILVVVIVCYIPVAECHTNLHWLLD